MAFGAESSAVAAMKATQAKAAQAQALRNMQLVEDAQTASQNRVASVTAESRTGHAIAFSPRYGTTIVGRRTYL